MKANYDKNDYFIDNTPTPETGDTAVVSRCGFALGQIHYPEDQFTRDSMGYFHHALPFVFKIEDIRSIPKESSVFAYEDTKRCSLVGVKISISRNMPKIIMNMTTEEILQEYGYIE